MTTSMADAQILASSIGNDFAQIVLTGPLVLAAGAAVMAGMVSFLSPCVLPLVPGYVGYVTGLSGTSLGEKTTWKVVVGTSLFVLGFTVIFVVMGTVMSYLGVVFAQWEDIVIRILGIVVIIAGFIFMGGFGLMQRNRQIRAKPKAGLWSAPLLGGIFALGWAPCVGPTLSAVLSLSYSFGGEGVIWRGGLPCIRLLPRPGRSIHSPCFGSSQGCRTSPMVQTVSEPRRQNRRNRSDTARRSNGQRTVDSVAELFARIGCGI